MFVSIAIKTLFSPPPPVSRFAGVLGVRSKLKIVICVFQLLTGKISHKDIARHAYINKYNNNIVIICANANPRDVPTFFSERRG